MKILAQLLQRKWSVLIITVIIFSFVILAIVYTRQLEQEQLQSQLTTEQQAKIEKFKSGKYTLSKGKTW
jgi:cell division protein FtsI/penicillin-binding protein 2